MTPSLRCSRPGTRTQGRILRAHWLFLLPVSLALGRAVLPSGDSEKPETAAGAPHISVGAPKVREEVSHLLANAQFMTWAGPDVYVTW